MIRSFRLFAAALATLSALSVLGGCSKAANHASATPSPAQASSPTPVPSAAPAASGAAQAPAVYQDLYGQLQSAVVAADRQVSSAWDGSKYPVNFAAELLTADSNGGFGILQDSVRKVMVQELDGEKSLGVQAVTVQIGFPLLDEQFYQSLGQTSDQAHQTVQRWLSYYTGVAEAVHSRGLKLIVEANPLLTLATGSDTSLDAAPYYKSLDVATYQARRGAHNVLVAQAVKPDYLVLQSEPQTDAVNVQNRQLSALLSDPVADTAMIGAFVSQLVGAGIPGLHSTIQLGAGVGTWQSDWARYVSGLATIPGLDKIDCHIYNLQPGLDEIGVASKIADMAHAAGKGATIAEFWLHKSVSLAGFSSNGDPLLDVRARDTFGFWAPLDGEFLQLMGKLAVAKRFDYVSGFGFFYWFALVDYGSLQAPCPPVYPAQNASQNGACDAAIHARQNSSAQAALASGQLSPTGLAYRAVISSFR